MNWNLLESEDAGLALVRAIGETTVCKLSASRKCDRISLLHLAAARGYIYMIRELLKLQVKLEGKVYSFVTGKKEKNNQQVFNYSAVREAHVSRINRDYLGAPLNP